MFPHANALGVSIGELFHDRDGVEHIDVVARLAVCARRLTFRIVVAAVIWSQDNVAAAGEAIHVGHVALSCAVLGGRNVTVVENDHGPAGTGRLAIRYRQESEIFVALRDVGGDVTFVVSARF